MRIVSKQQIPLFSLYLTFFSTLQPVSSAPILAGSDIQSVQLVALNYTKCQHDYPTSCCFSGVATLKTVYDNLSISSFTLSGTQMGKNCPDQLVFIPSDTTITQIIMNKYYVRTQSDQASSFIFYTGSRNQQIDGQTKYDYQFSLHLATPTQSSVNAFQDFMLQNTNLPIEEAVQSQSSYSYNIIFQFSSSLLIVMLLVLIF